MKTKLALLTITLQTFCDVVYGQPSFQRILGGYGIYGSYASQMTSDKGYIMAGQYSLVKTDSSGNINWTKNYNLIIFQSVKQTPDGGYIAAGMKFHAASQQDFCVVRTDSMGDTLWTRSYGGADDDWAYDLELTPDSGYIIGGGSQSFMGAFVIKVNDQGDTVWTRTYGNGGVYSISQTNDNNFIVAGSCPGNAGDAFLIKINQNGDTLWTKKYGGNYEQAGFEAIQTMDGGYAIIGTTMGLPNAGGLDILLVKTDSLGNHLWSKAYGDYWVDEGYALRQTSDGGYILAGRMQMNGGGGGGNCGALGPCYDYYLIKTDAAGDTLWTKMYGGSNLDFAYSIDITPDGGYIITGQTADFNNGGSGTYIIKTDANGNVPCNQYNTNTIVNTQTTINGAGFQVSSGGMIYDSEITLGFVFQTDSLLCITTGINETLNELNEVIVFPNPVQDVININSTINFSAAQFILYDASARIVLDKKFTKQSTFSVAHLQSGIYFYELRDKEGKAEYGKVIKE